MRMRDCHAESFGTSAPGEAHGGNRLLAALPAGVLSSLRDDLDEVLLPQGFVVYEPADPIEKIYFPQTGLISLLVIAADGNLIETAMVGREGAIGLHRVHGERRSLTRATVQAAGLFSVVPGARFKVAVGASAVAREAIARYTEWQWAEAQQLAACNALHDASSRLCRWLLQSADRRGSDELHLTQEFLSQVLGIRRTSVTLLAQALQRKGLIRYSRRAILIVDRAGLEACACECYNVTKQLSRDCVATLGTSGDA